MVIRSALDGNVISTEGACALPPFWYNGLMREESLNEHHDSRYVSDDFNLERPSRGWESCDFAIAVEILESFRRPQLFALLHEFQIRLSGGEHVERDVETSELRQLLFADASKERLLSRLYELIEKPPYHAMRYTFREP